MQPKQNTLLNGLVLMMTLVLATALLLAVGSCGKEPRKPAGRLDTPSHHALRGNDFLDKGQIGKAEKSFNMALSLDKNYSPALSGLAITKASNAAKPGVSGDDREDLADEARSLIAKGISKSQSDDQKRTAYIAGIRVYRLTKMPEDWLEDAEGHYEDALDLDERRVDPDPHYYMARAYRDAFDLGKAQELYGKVLSMRGRKSREANLEMAVLQKILRAEPGSTHGRVVAFAESLTRADVAALFIEELNLERLYERGNAKRFDTGFKAPANSKSTTTFKTDTLQTVPDVLDIKDHPMRADIEEILRLRVVGLEPDPAHNFHPDKTTNRAEFAMMLEDVLVKVTGEQKLKTRFIGQKSPFPDVRSDVPYFNAVQTVTSRSLLEPINKVRGIFGPTKPVAGADALLALRVLKQELQSFIRQ